MRKFVEDFLIPMILAMLVCVFLLVVIYYGWVVVR